MLGAVAAMAFAPVMASAQTGNPGGAINDNLGEMDYGVCRGTDPKCFHDWPRAKRTGPLKVLLYTRTAGPAARQPRRGPGPGLNPPLADDNVVQNGMLRLAAENGWTLDYTEDVSQMQNWSATTR
jgi:hypothetical protein